MFKNESEKRYTDEEVRRRAMSFLSHVIGDIQNEILRMRLKVNALESSVAETETENVRLKRKLNALLKQRAEFAPFPPSSKPDFESGLSELNRH